MLEMLEMKCVMNCEVKCVYNWKSVIKKMNLATVEEEFIDRLKNWSSFLSFRP